MMMAKINNDSYYTIPNEHLEQGDIFRIDIVSPAADEVQRIFRSKDGRHGSVVFEENCEAMIFSRAELDNLLENTSQTPLHTRPFSKSPDGQEEMVVVFSRLFHYFIIATQTCDICGLDKDPHEWATILPIITLAELCKNEPLPFKKTERIMTIQEFLNEYCEESSELENATDIEYGHVIKNIVKDLAESATDKNVKEDAKYIKKYLNEYHKPMYIYYLAADQTVAMPESFIDFTSAYTVPTSKLLALKNTRFIKISNLYRTDFAQKFGLFFSRIALPQPMRPPKI